MIRAALTGLPEAGLALVAVGNILPILPLVQQYTSELPSTQARTYQLRALFQGTTLALGFLLAAPLLLDVLSLSMGDLRVAGGAVLLVYATHDLLFSHAERKERVIDGSEHPVPAELPTPVAPLGVPILVGPATLSLLLVLGEQYGTITAMLALFFTALANAVLLVLAEPIIRLTGEGVSQAVGKAMSLLLATLGAGMLRAGIAG